MEDKQKKKGFIVPELIKYDEKLDEITWGAVPSVVDDRQNASNPMLNL